MEKEKIESSVLEKADKALFPKPVRIFNQLRLYALLFFVLLFAGAWLYRTYPWLLFIIPILCLGGVFLYKRGKEEREIKAGFEEIGKRAKERDAEWNRQGETTAGEEAFKKAFKLLSLLNDKSKLSFEEFKKEVTRLSDPVRNANEITEQEIWRGFQYLLANQNLRFNLDWKWGGPDYVCKNYLAKMIPGFLYNFTKNAQISDGWSDFEIEGTIMDEPVKATVSGGIPHDFIDKIVNPILEKKIEKKLEPRTTDGDNHDFILVPLNKFDEVKSEEFKPFWA